MKHFILSFILLFACCMASQATDIERPEYTYKSPEAMSFQRQGQFQVGEYTGSANISFPLHTIKYKDIELPITLSYNSSGVQVAAEASWVGLNWDINIGGCINLIPCGGVDAPNNVRYTSIDSTIIKNVLNKGKGDYCFNYNIDYGKCCSALTYKDIPYEAIDAGKRGIAERDIYSVSLPSGSFLFYINLKDEPEIIGGDCKNKIERYINIEKTESWKITDSNGYIYEFECPDLSPSQGTNGKPYTSAWFLTKITSPLGSNVIFTYTTNSCEIDLSPKLKEQSTIFMGMPIGMTASKSFSYDKNFKQTYIYYPQSTIQKRYLDSIKAGDQTITFTLSSRNDLKGGQKLDCICISEYGKTPKKICFDYDYFNSNTVGGDYLVQYNGGTSSSDYSKLRLKLKSFYYESENKKVSDLHSFEYKENIGFPNKNSFAVDMWGYYNRQENKIDGRYTFCPAPRYCDVDKDTYNATKDYKGANRFANPDYVDALSLKKIIYPTKGYTEFTFESNTFMKEYQNPFASGRNDIAYTEKIVVEDVNFVNNSRNNYATGPDVKKDFTLYKKYEGVLTVKINAGSLHLSDLASGSANVTLMYRAALNQPFIPLQKITISTSSDISKIKTFEKEVNVNLPAGYYMFFAELPYRISQETGASVKGILTYDVCPEPGEKIETLGGGIRIHSIKNYDSDNTLLEETYYEYTNEDGNSSGIHITPNRFHQHTIKDENFGEWLKTPYTGIDLGLYVTTDEALVHRLQILDSPIGVTPFVSTIHNNNVGYSRVIKRVKGGNRVQVSNYANNDVDFNIECSFVFNGSYKFKTNELCTRIQPQNGQLLTQELFDNNDKLVHKLVNKYAYNSTMKKVNFFIEELGTLETLDGSIPSMYVTGKMPMLFTCYSFENYWIRLASTISTDYANGTPTTRKETTYKYNTKNLQTSQIDENTNIAGQIRRTKISYSADLTDNVGNNMRKAHRLNDVVENKIVLVENGVEKKTISTQQTEYSQYYPYLPISQLSSIGSYSPEVRVKYGYDAKNNIRSIIKDGMETVYLWSYNGQYPIAKIEGLTYSEVDNALKSDSLSIASLSGYTHPNATVFNKIRTAINNIGGYITTYTYIPLVGIETETKANGLKTTYQYDGFGRLIKVLDHNGKVISTNEYNYKK